MMLFGGQFGDDLERLGTVRAREENGVLGRARATWKKPDGSLSGIGTRPSSGRPGSESPYFRSQLALPRVPPLKVNVSAA